MKKSKWHQLSFKIDKRLFPAIEDVAKAQNTSISDACRKLFSLEHKAFNLNLGKYDRQFFRWVMTLSMVQMSFIMYLENQEKFFISKKKKVKADFFKYVRRVLMIHKFFYEDVVMPKIAKQMDIILGDNESEKEADFIEDLSVLIDNADSDDRKTVRGLANKYRSRFEVK